MKAYYVLPFTKIQFMDIHTAMHYCNHSVDCDEPFEISAFEHKTQTRLPGKDYRWTGKWERRASYGKWQDA